MSDAIRGLVCDRRGVAAVELAIIVPVLAVLFGCVIDFGLFLWTKGRVAAAVAEGTQYAFSTGVTITAEQVQGFVQQSASVNLSSTNVNVVGPACYCASGIPRVLSSQSCTTPCSDGSSAGTYLTVTVSLPYRALLPALSRLANRTVVETATVRLK